MTDNQGIFYLNLLTKERTRVKPANNLNFQPNNAPDNSDIKPLPPAIKPLPQPPPAHINPNNPMGAPPQSPQIMMNGGMNPNMMSPQQYQWYQHQQQMYQYQMSQRQMFPQN